MKTKGINLENVKLNNRATVLSMLNRQGAMSRKDLAEKIGLTAATMTLICTELLEEGILCELGEADQTEKRAGRKKILVDINRSYKKVLCVSIEADETYITLTDMGGTVLGEQKIATDKKKKPEVFLRVIASICKDLVWKCNIAKDDILAVGVTVPGKINRKAGIAVNAFNIWNEPVEISKILSEELGFEVIVENNVKAYAESELTYGNGRNQDNMLIVKWGPGVGSAIIIDGKIYRGATNQAAELGHTIVYKDGKICSCGKTGCLETGISTHAICADVDEAIAEGRMKILKDWLGDRRASDVEICQWAAIDDPELQELIDSKMEVLAFSVGNIACMLNPDTIIVYGYIFENEGFIDRFRETFNSKYAAVDNPVEILRSDLQDKAYYSGALALVMNEHIFKH